jgi:flagellar biosynthesis protein FlhF
MEGKPVNLKTYQAFTMAEALTAVKQHLGTDAVILNTRTFRRRVFFGLWRRLIVEVTAVAARESQQGQRENSKRAPNATTAMRAYGQSTANAKSSVAPKPAPHNDLDRTRTLALALKERHSRSNGNANSSDVATSAASRAAEGVKPTALPSTSPTAKRFVLTSAISDRAAPSVDTPTQLAQAKRSEPRMVTTDSMQEELSSIKELVGRVLHRQALTTGQPSTSMPKHLFEMYLKLISQEVSDEMADQIVNAVRTELSSDELEDEGRVREAVRHQLESFIPIAEQAVPTSTQDGRPLIIALIGPTGVGKTTTVAKLAASFKLRHGKKVGLITSDTYRIAAVDQLRTYANIIGLQLEIAMTPREMAVAVDRLSDSDVILIDTAGRSQNDGRRLSELQEFIVAANPHEVHLVLSSTAGEKVLLHEAQAFCAVGVNKIVLTKLDEAVNFGMLINVIRQVGKQLSFITTGQEVPTDLEVGKAHRLADLILGAPLKARAAEVETQQV